MRIVLIATVGAVLVLVLIVGLAGVFLASTITSELAKPQISVTTIEYLEFTHPGTGIKIVLRGLHSEIDTRVLFILAAIAD